MTSAAGRVIATWPGHCFSPAAGAAGRGRGGGPPGSPPPSALGQGQAGAASLMEGPKASTSLGLGFFPLEWRCVG